MVNKLIISVVFEDIHNERAKHFRIRPLTYMKVKPFSLFSVGIRVWEEHRMEHSRRDTCQHTTLITFPKKLQNRLNPQYSNIKRQGTVVRKVERLDFS